MKLNTNGQPIPLWAIAIIAVFLGIVLFTSGGGSVKSKPYSDYSNIESLPSSEQEELYPIGQPFSINYPNQTETDVSPNGEQREGTTNPDHNEGETPRIYARPPNPAAEAKATAEFSAPKLHDILTIGQTFSISWNSAEIGNRVRVKIYEAAVSECDYDRACLSSTSKLVKNYVLHDNLENNGRLNWQIGAVVGQDTPLRAEKYFLRLETLDGKLLGDSETFAVIPSNLNPYIDVAIPYDPEAMPYEIDPLPYSSQYDIAQGVFWRASPSISFVDIFVRVKGCPQSCPIGSGLYQIARAAPNGYLFAWYPGRADVNGNHIPPGDYELYIQDVADTTIKSAPHIFILE